MAAAKRVKVAEAGEIPEGEARVVEADGHTLALFNVSGTFYALDNACAHRGGPLGEGDLDGRLVSCPWHAWRWPYPACARRSPPRPCRARVSVRGCCFLPTLNRSAKRTSLRNPQ